MKNKKTDRLAAYLLWAFGAAWVLQIAAGMMFRAGAGLAYSALLAVSMFAPLLAAVLSGAGVKGVGLRFCGVEPSGLAGKSKEEQH